MSLVKEKEIVDIKKGPCFSIMVDETSDINNRKPMAVGVKYLKDSKNKISFIHDSELDDGKAETIIIPQWLQLLTNVVVLKKEWIYLQWH